VNTVKPFLMGAEVEYSMSATQAGRPISRQQVHELLLAAVRSDHRWLPDARSTAGIYIDNGSRYYLDTGAHNELSSPELSSPRQVAVYDRAAEHILLAARDSAMRRTHGMQVCITKNNVNFAMPDGPAWGQHEAYTCWVPLQNAARQLIPHLVSRVPYAGAGCLSAAEQGNGFELSQRARHMTRETGNATTSDRAIFCTRAWKPSDVSEAGWTRTNLISKDSQRCSFGMYLSYGTTGLLFLAINAGCEVGATVRLANPVTAMRTLSLDPWSKAKVPLADGRQMSACEIQRAYLSQAEAFVAKGGCPDWAHEVLDHWTATLEHLESDPSRLADRLDTYLKLAIFDHELSRAGYDWGRLKAALQVLTRLRRNAPEQVVRAIVDENSKRLDSKHQLLYDRVANDEQLNKLGAEPLRLAIRLQALELKYHELGGLFDKLAAARHVDPVVVTPEAVRQAVHHPPPAGRAEARSRCIHTLSAQKSWACDWEGIFNRSKSEWFDMRDPFSSECHQSGFPPVDPRQPLHRRALANLVMRMTDRP
jgi:Pup-ligase protein